MAKEKQTLEESGKIAREVARAKRARKKEREAIAGIKFGQKPTGVKTEKFKEVAGKLKKSGQEAKKRQDVAEERFKDSRRHKAAMADADALMRRIEAKDRYMKKRGG